MATTTQAPPPPPPQRSSSSSSLTSSSTSSTSLEKTKSSGSAIIPISAISGVLSYGGNKGMVVQTREMTTTTANSTGGLTTTTTGVVNGRQGVVSGYTLNSATGAQEFMEFNANSPHRVEETRRVSSVVVSEQYMGELPNTEERIKYVEVEQIQEVIKTVPRKEIVEVEKRVPKYEYEWQERVVEVPQIQYIDKQVEVPRVQEIIRKVPKLQVVDVPKEVIRTVPKVEIRQVEKVVQVPGEIIEVPKPYTVQNKVGVHRFLDTDMPVVVAQTTKPLLVESDHVIDVDVVDFEPEVIPVDVHVIKPVQTCVHSTGEVVQERHKLVTVPTAQYNTLLKQLNAHIDYKESGLLPFVQESNGMVAFLADQTQSRYVPLKAGARIEGLETKLRAKHMSGKQAFRGPIEQGPVVIPQMNTTAILPVQQARSYTQQSAMPYVTVTPPTFVAPPPMTTTSYASSSYISAPTISVAAPAISVSAPAVSVAAPAISVSASVAAPVVRAPATTTTMYTAPSVATTTYQTPMTSTGYFGQASTYVSKPATTIEVSRPVAPPPPPATVEYRQYSSPTIEQRIMAPATMTTTSTYVNRPATTTTTVVEASRTPVVSSPQLVPSTNAVMSQQYAHQYEAFTAGGIIYESIPVAPQISLITDERGMIERAAERVIEKISTSKVPSQAASQMASQMQSQMQSQMASQAASQIVIQQSRQQSQIQSQVVSEVLGERNVVVERGTKSGAAVSSSVGTSSYTSSELPELRATDAEGRNCCGCGGRRRKEAEGSTYVLKTGSAYGNGSRSTAQVSSKYHAMEVPTSQAPPASVVPTSLVEEAQVVEEVVAA